MRIAMIGSGALAGFYGGCLLRAGHELHLVARSDLPTLRARGLRVDSPSGDMRFERISATDRPEELPPCDLVCVGIKTTGNEALPRLLQVPLSDDGQVLVLQNGLGVEAEAAAVVGAERVLGGLCFLCAHRLAPGHIAHLDYGRITFGRYRADGRPAGVDERLRQVATVFAGAGIETLLADDLQQARWRKLVWNVPFNGLCTLLRCTTDALLADGQGRELVEDCMAAVLDGARACGHPIEADFIGRMMEDTRAMVAYKPSMLLDAEAGRALEVEHLFGAPWRAATAAGCPLPLLGTLYRQLACLDRLGRGDAPELGGATPAAARS